MFIYLLRTDPASCEIYTLSLHDALPISSPTASASSGRSPCTRLASSGSRSCAAVASAARSSTTCASSPARRSEEHTSELQSQFHLVCRLLLEKKNILIMIIIYNISAL